MEWIRSAASDATVAKRMTGAAAEDRDEAEVEEGGAGSERRWWVVHETSGYE